MSSDVTMADAEAETHNAGGGELLVWPWTGILATTTDDDDATADAASTLAFHAHQHFAGVPTTALQEATAGDGHHHHFLVLHFGKSWAGLRDAMSLPGRFPGAGRRDGVDGEGATAGAVYGWLAGEDATSGAVYGWPAGEDDLHDGDGVVGRFLRDAGGAARSAEDVERDEGRVAAKLAVIAGEHERRAVFLERKCEEMAGAAQNAEAGNTSLHDELKDMEAIYAKLNQLEKQLEQRQSLESIIRQMNMNLQAGGSLRKEDHEHIYSIMMCLRTIVDEEKEMLVDSCAEIMKRLRTNSDELEEYRQELIKGVENMTITASTIIGIKRMGELDERPFHLACKRKHREDDPRGKAAMLISYWQEELKNPSWHPFNIIQVDGEDKGVVDEDDRKLRQLCKDYGDSVCNAVKAAMAELNEYNPRGRHTMNELWNFREGRKATTKEVVKYISDQLKTNSSQSDN
uniref:Factor of DNA methylation 1-5/IDN2 domain-containing protein n=1 Tax=Oryza barthii TaxID=65489 RepID=A0A0D3EJJ9_9ORYZ